MKAKQIIALILDGLGALLCIAWLFFPVAPGPVDLQNGVQTIQFVPYKMVMQIQELQAPLLFTQLLYAIYFVPLLGLYRLVSFFFLKKTRLACDSGRHLSQYTAYTRNHMCPLYLCTPAPFVRGCHDLVCQDTA